MNKTGKPPLLRLQLKLADSRRRELVLTEVTGLLTEQRETQASIDFLGWAKIW
jgi:hypothetical protein